MFLGRQRSQFNAVSFNRIFVIYAINNIIAELLYYFFFRINSTAYNGLFQYLSNYHHIMAIAWQLLYHTSMTTNLLDFILSLNRFTAVLIPIGFKSFWNGKIKWVVAFVIIFPYICFWPFIFQEVTFVCTNIEFGHDIVFIRPPPILWPDPTSILGACVTVTCVACFFCNAYVGYKLHRRKNIGTSYYDKMEKLYFLFMMCVFGNQILSCSTQVSLLN